MKSKNNWTKATLIVDKTAMEKLKNTPIFLENVEQKWYSQKLETLIEMYKKWEIKF